MVWAHCVDLFVSSTYLQTSGIIYDIEMPNTES